MPFLGAAGIGGLVAFLKAGVKPDVFGGVLSEDATYFYRTFFGSSTLTIASGILNADVLVVAGGGGGGIGIGGGGGAGGYQSFANQSLAATSYAITVGAGGGGAINQNTDRGFSGGNSQFGALTASVGGGGGTGQSYLYPSGTGGVSGGSGGGGARNNTTPGSGTSGQGNAGGNGSNTSSSYGSGGGGGAGAVGANGSGTSGGAGGAGLQWLNGAYYAGGGGGVGDGNTGFTSGGVGGGGASGATGFAATINTGGGGGGSSGGTGSTGGAGGSGIVILRYLKSAVKASTSAYELIGTVSLSASQTSVVFGGLPASQYKHLQLRVVARSDAANTSDDIYLRFNGDATSSNYYYHGLYGTGSAAGSESNGSLAGARILQATAANNTAGSYGIGYVDILDFANTTKYKTLRSLNGHADGLTRVWLSSNLWASTAAISSITIVPASGGNFISGSRFSLYGLRG